MDTEMAELCALLERLLEGAIQAKDAKAKLRYLGMADLGELRPNLFHYIDDADIRKKDSNYKELQDSEMKKVLRCLRAGDLAKANTITFLRRTAD